MATLFTELLATIRDTAAQVPGIKAAYYPAPNTLNDAALPCVVVYSGSPRGETVIERGQGGQMWLPNVMVRVYGKRTGETPQEFAKIDALIEPLADAFDRSFTVNVDGTPHHIDRIHTVGVMGTLQVPYAGHEHYAAELYLSIKYRRAGG